MFSAFSRTFSAATRVADAVITATLEAVSAHSTKVTVSTDLRVTGKVAQFGRGVMGDVSEKLMAQFASNLNTMLDSEPDTASVATESAAESAFNELLKMVDRTIGRPAAAEESFTWATLMWSAAHGFATLLIDGPLERKLPIGVVVDQLITDVVALLTEMVERQAAAMGLAPSATSAGVT